MMRRFPKFGFRKNRFNRNPELEKLNLGSLAYHIEKGHLNPDEPITMRGLVEAGVLSKITKGVKLLGKGSDKFSALKTPINLEITDASTEAINAVKSTREG
mmetsp:Transcript_30637/g.37870  ORF Transcript_30637/g.37870 Transcript_30637/m.37870 type:complete len:101 (+) Transcript_30637:345-647(+)